MRQEPVRADGPEDGGAAELPAGVSWTGLMTAHMRAVESGRADALFDDPLATALVKAVGHANHADGGAALPTGPDEGAGELSEMWYMLSTFLGVRTRYYDEVVTAAADAGVRQVVILAAGFDARAYRLGLPDDTTLFEVDTEPVLRFKERVLAGTDLTSTVRREAVPADLRGPWHQALTRAGFVPGLPTMWLVEGLFMYVAPDACDALLDRLTRLSGPGSRIALEYYESAPRLQDTGARGAVEEAVADYVLSFFQAGPGRPPAAWLAERGWRSEVTTLAREISARGRRIPLMFQRGRPHEVSLWLASGRLD
ncbi:SAM-dependent methyltransferase [Streptomyces sp. NBC_01497]|uniref:SAM-dependent methyltransferase n=1 Tax=Streptomyces sp. NBC_01497 TaxID=2903885 RepID=UPI002E360E9D|nr:SAM-dependent methyltransferase [Streptomyces sp. NBC_01497]